MIAGIKTEFILLESKDMCSGSLSKPHPDWTVFSAGTVQGESLFRVRRHTPVNNFWSFKSSAPCRTLFQYNRYMTGSKGFCNTWTLKVNCGSTLSSCIYIRGLNYLWKSMWFRTTAESELPGPRALGKSLALWTLFSVQFSRSVVSDSLWPHGLQHARPPCPSPTPGLYSNSCPLSQWCHPTILSFVIPFSSCLQSFQASGSFPMSQFFASGGQSSGVSA